MGGYSLRGNPLFGINLNTFTPNVSDVNLTYTSLLYGNGPGNLRAVRNYNLTNEETG
jgi:alkaline phosphatase